MLEPSTVLYVIKYSKRVQYEVPYVNLPQTAKDFYEKNIKITFEKAAELCIETVLQNSSKWKDARSVRITASKAYTLYTYRNNTDPAKWKMKAENYLYSDFIGNADTRHGLGMEDRARKAYESLTGNNVTQVGFIVNPLIPWLGYNPDGIVENKCIIEIKSPKIGKTMNVRDALPKIPYLIMRGNNVAFKEKHMYYCQIQLGMFLIKQCHFVIFCSKDKSCNVFEIKYDSILVTQKYIPALQSIYFRYILKSLISSQASNDKENVKQNVNV